MATNAKTPDGKKRRKKPAKDGLTQLADGRFRFRVYLYGTKGTRENPAPRKSITLPRGWTRNQALAFLKTEQAKAAALRGKPFLKRFTVRDAFEEMQSYYSTASVAPNTVAIVTQAGAHLLPLLGDRRLTDLRAGDVEAYQRQRTAEKAAAATINGEVRWLRSALKRAVRARWIDSDPLPAGAVKPVQGVAVVAEPLTPSEWSRFRDSIDDDAAWQLHEARSFAPLARDPETYRDRLRGAAVALRVLLLTGSRVSEITGLKWETVDLEAGRIRIYQAKVRKWKTLPLSPATRAILESLPRGTPGASVFTQSDTGEPWDRLTLARALDSLVRVAGLRRDIGPHTLRHTTATWLTAGGVPEAVAGDILGHAGRSMTARYISNADATILEALVRLETVEKCRVAPSGRQRQGEITSFLTVNRAN